MGENALPPRYPRPLLLYREKAGRVLPNRRYAGLSCARPLTGCRAAATAACALPGLKENPLYVSSVGVGTVRQAAWPNAKRLPQRGQ